MALQAQPLARQLTIWSPLYCFSALNIRACSCVVEAVVILIWKGFSSSEITNVAQSLEFRAVFFFTQSIWSTKEGGAAALKVTRSGLKSVFMWNNARSGRRCRGKYADIDNIILSVACFQISSSSRWANWIMAIVTFIVPVFVWARSREVAKFELKCCSTYWALSLFLSLKWDDIENVHLDVSLLLLLMMYRCCCCCCYPAYREFNCV